jgi:hypothetical protein
MPTPARIPIIATTISSSISVNDFLGSELIALKKGRTTCDFNL